MFVSHLYALIDCVVYSAMCSVSATEVPQLQARGGWLGLGGREGCPLLKGNLCCTQTVDISCLCEWSDYTWELWKINVLYVMWTKKVSILMKCNDKLIYSVCVFPLKITFLCHMFISSATLQANLFCFIIIVCLVVFVEIMFEDFGVGTLTCAFTSSVMCVWFILS